MNELIQMVKNIFSLSATILLLIFGLVFSGCGDSTGKDGSEQYTKTEGEGSLMIIGGGSRPAEMIQRMITESGLDHAGYAIVLTMSAANPDTSGYYGETQFRQQGVTNVRSYDLGRRDIATENALDSLQNASLVYITGGSQSRFMRSVEEFPEIGTALINAYESGAMISGTSAGASVMSRIMITGDQQNYPDYTATFYHLEKDNIITERGLGLIEGVIVDQHFLKRARNNRLLTAVMEYPNHIGIGVDEATAVLIKNGQAEVVGEAQVLVYQNLSGESKVNNGRLGANNIRLDIYLPGDLFEL
ncbi:MAG: cyanophycinase [Balneolaceae bacterium]|nr:MAG: cyanophycinase [Balneolaceae bacterium]